MIRSVDRGVVCTLQDTSTIDEMLHDAGRNGGIPTVSGALHTFVSAWTHVGEQAVTQRSHEFSGT